MYLNQNLTFVFMPAMRETYFSKIKEKKNEKKKKKKTLFTGPLWKSKKGPYNEFIFCQAIIITFIMTHLKLVKIREGRERRILQKKTAEKEWKKNKRKKK